MNRVCKEKGKKENRIMAIGNGCYRRNSSKQSGKCAPSNFCIEIQCIKK